MAPSDCSTAGCVDGVEVHSPPGVDDLSAGTLTVCVGDACNESRFSFGGPGAVENLEFDEAGVGDRATAVLELPDGTSYRDAAELMQVQPNGDGCAPVCAYAALHLEPTD